MPVDLISNITRQGFQPVIVCPSQSRSVKKLFRSRLLIAIQGSWPEPFYPHKFPTRSQVCPMAANASHLLSAAMRKRIQATFAAHLS
jgi:hypothetical protein